MTLTRETVVRKCELVILLLGLMTSSLVAEVPDEKAQRAIVAIVEGQEILYEEIKSDPEIFREMHPDWDDIKIEDAVFSGRIFLPKRCLRGDIGWGIKTAWTQGSLICGPGKA